METERNIYVPKKADKYKAERYYVLGMNIKDIAAKLGVSKVTIHNWKNEGRWQERKEQAYREYSERIAKEVIEEQIKIAKQAQTELLIRLEKQAKAREIITQLEQHWQTLVDTGRVDRESYKDFYKAMRAAQNELINETTLVKIMTHGLDVIRPKTVQELNFLRTDNKSVNILVNIPDAVKEKLNELQKQYDIN